MLNMIKTIKPEIVNTCWGRARGFMFSFSRKPKLFVFSRSGKYSIHMFFVFQKLKVIWLDANKKEIYSVIAKPFGIYAPKGENANKAKYILEIPLGK